MMPERMQHQDAWRDLDRAERLAHPAGADALRDAIAIATRVWHVAEARRSELEPSPWDDGAWAQWTLVMTRASVLLLRFRQALRAWEAERAPSSSGVRSKAPPVVTRIVVVEPNAGLRERLGREAESSGVELMLVEQPDRLEPIRDRESPPLVACRFPLEGADELVRDLRRERAPVAIMTGDVAGAVAAFGVRTPIVPDPVQLVRLLEVALDIAGGEGPRAITELPVAANARDPRRE